jgi:hypothetical protein
MTRPPFTPEDRAVVWEKTGGKCVYCGVVMNPFRDFTIDHVVPLARGGSYDLDNLAPCCRTCNCSKGTKHHANWQRRKSRITSVEVEESEPVYLFLQRANRTVGVPTARIREAIDSDGETRLFQYRGIGPWRIWKIDGARLLAQNLVA